MIYARPLPRFDTPRPKGAFPLAGGPLWFTQVVMHEREGPERIKDADTLPTRILERLTAPRAPIAGLAMDRPNVMGILNVTPDSFSDGGRSASLNDALQNAKAMIAQGADLIDVGGESTRPGAETVPTDEEISRVVGPIEAICNNSSVPISIDTRKKLVAEAAHQAGAKLVNDVAGFTYDPALAPYCAAQELPVCVMHAQGDPATMQADPKYDNVALEVSDFLEQQVAWLERQGMPRSRITIDPGIGFGKSQAHNLTLLHNIALFHAIGCPILLGASRKGFIGKIGNAPDASKRSPGSVAVALHALSQGVQIIRVHDVGETTQAIALWQAVTKGQTNGA